MVNLSFTACERNVIDSAWLTVKSVDIGQVLSGKGTPNKYYSIAKDNEPYLLVKVYYEYETTFLSFIVWCDFLFFGMPDYVSYINLRNFEIHQFKFDKYDFYFGYFYQYSKFLFIASSCRLYCLDSNLALVWKTEEIAVDGVIIHDFTDNYLQVSGECDPPGGWINYEIDVATGKIITKST